MPHTPKTRPPEGGVPTDSKATDYQIEEFKRVASSHDKPHELRVGYSATSCSSALPLLPCLALATQASRVNGPHS